MGSIITQMSTVVHFIFGRATPFTWMPKIPGKWCQHTACACLPNEPDCDALYQSILWVSLTENGLNLQHRSLSITLNWTCLSQCFIDSLGTHLFTAVRVKPEGKKHEPASPAFLVLPNIRHSHGAIAGAGCYRKVSVTADVFHCIMIQWNVELLWSCERRAYGEMVCICSSAKPEPSPKLTPSFLFAAEAN